MSKICLLIHGYLTDYHDFTSLPQELIKTYDEVILLTLPGHEHKENLNNFTKVNVFNFLNKEIRKLMNPLKNNTVDIIGFSLGGALAWYFCQRYNFHKVVMLAPAIHNLNLLHPLELIDKSIELSKLPLKKKKIAFKKAFERETNAIKFAITKTGPKFSLNNGIEFLKIIDYINNNVKPTNTKMLIIRGELDELVKMKGIKKIIANHQGEVEFYEVPNIGHMMLRTDYEQTIIKKIIKFLKSE